MRQAAIRSAQFDSAIRRDDRSDDGLVERRWRGPEIPEEHLTCAAPKVLDPYLQAQRALHVDPHGSGVRVDPEVNLWLQHQRINKVAARSEREGGARVSVDHPVRSRTDGKIR